MSDLREKKLELSTLVVFFRTIWWSSVNPSNQALTEVFLAQKFNYSREIHVKKYCPDYGKFEFYCKKSSVCSLCVRTERSLSHQCKNAFEKYYLFVPNFCCTLTHDKYQRYVTCNLLIFVSDYSIYISRNT